MPICFCLLRTKKLTMNIDARLIFFGLKLTKIYFKFCMKTYALEHLKIQYFSRITLGVSVYNESCNSCCKLLLKIICKNKSSAKEGERERVRKFLLDKFLLAITCHCSPSGDSYLDKQLKKKQFFFGNRKRNCLVFFQLIFNFCMIMTHKLFYFDKPADFCRDYVCLFFTVFLQKRI